MGLAACSKSEDNTSNPSAPTTAMTQEQVPGADQAQASQQVADGTQGAATANGTDANNAGNGITTADAASQTQTSTDTSSTGTGSAPTVDNNTTTNNTSGSN
jgi:hypothetical protein